jgi:HKD family nuclease
MTNSKVFIVLLFAIISCNIVPENENLLYCGYQMTDHEYQLLRNKSQSQKSSYDIDSSGKIYDQINDSLRSAMPDTMEFEIFLSFLNKDEVGVDVIVPANKNNYERIGCVIMNSNFTDKMPSQRYLCIYTYTNPDGNGDSPLEIAIKRKN